MANGVACLLQIEDIYRSGLVLVCLGKKSELSFAISFTYKKNPRYLLPLFAATTSKDALVTDALEA